MKKNLILFLFFSCPALLVTVLAGPLNQKQAGMAGNILLDKKTGHYSLGLHISILEDPTNKMTIKEAASPAMTGRYTACKDESPSFGFNNASYWAHFKISNMREKDEEWLLELDYPHMDVVEVYYREPRGDFATQLAGDTYDFVKREINYRNFVFPLIVPRKGGLDVFLRFSGSCSKQFPLALWSPESFADKIIKEKFFLGLYYGIILVMALYNLFLFFFIRDRSYFFYVIYICSYGLVQMAYNGLAFQYLWPTMPGWHNISLPVLIGVAISLMALFTQSFLHTGEQSKIIHWSLIGVIGIGIMTIVYSLFGNYLTAIESAMKLMVLASMVITISAIVCMTRGFRPARFFLAAWLFFLLGLVLIALNKLHVLPVMFITEYANQIGSAVEVTLLSVALADRINIMNQEKKAAQRATIQAQEKYKLLVEGSNDIIFSLNEKWEFITANNAISTHLRVTPESVIGTNFLDLFYDYTEDALISKEILREKLNEFMSYREPLSFRAMFKSTITAEPKEMDIRLEYITIEGKNEILGKASRVEEDVFLKYFDCEHQNFTIGNYLIAAEDMTQRVTRNLKKYLEQKQINLLRIALREMIINAIEHGNLNISFDEKSEATMGDGYFELIAERRQDPRYRDRKVHIEYTLDPIKAVYRITDEGDGFNHGKIMLDNSEDANRDLLAHGRGISMAKNVFDAVTYNPRGNQVTLVKKIRKSA